MNEREGELLHRLVAEYIRSGKPIGSELLSRTAMLDVSPATIRNMLRVLEEEGFIEQPHTSAGRIPTDKGYRHYVNALVSKDVNNRQKEKIARELTALNEAYGRPSRATAKLLAHLANCLTISGWMDARDVQEAGFKEFMQESDETENAALQEIAFLLDHVDRYLRQLSATHEARGNGAIYIGSENPLFEAVHTSSLVRTVELPSGEMVVLLMVGPKRMPYQRNMALLNSVASILEEESL